MFIYLFIFNVLTMNTVHNKKSIKIKVIKIFILFHIITIIITIIIIFNYL